LVVKLTLRALPGSTFRLDTDSIIDSVADPLLAAKVSLGCLYRYMSKQKLNLIQFAACLMAEPGASSAEIVWSEFLDAGFSRIMPDQVPDDLFAQPASPYSAGTCHTPEDLPTRDPG
jgi:hypothetical protein